MRYQEMVRQYLAVREASSREWGISPTLVMCVELETAAEAYLTIAVASSSTQRRQPPRFLRVTLFRRRDSDGRTMFHGYDVFHDRDLRFSLSHEHLSDAEFAAIAERKAAIALWVAGKGDLPLSTSTMLADRLQRSDVGA